MKRRTVIQAGVAAGLAGVWAPGVLRAQTPEASPAASPATGWSFTDDRGVTASFERAPTVLAAQTVSAASLWDFGIAVDGVYGGLYLADGTTPDPQLGNVDPAQVVDLGGWEGFDIEGAVALGVQLVIDIDRGGGMWGLNADDVALVEEIAQTVAISTTVAADQTVSRFEELAIALGADPGAPEFVAAKEAYATAETRLREVAAAKPGLKVLVMTGDDTNVYFVNPEKAGDLMFYTSLGVDIVVPENPDPAQLDVFETRSWEEIGAYPAGVILFDARFDPATVVPAELWANLPAVVAGQVGVWESVYPNSWQGLTAVLTALADTLEAAEVVV